MQTTSEMLSETIHAGTKAKPKPLPVGRSASELLLAKARRKEPKTLADLVELMECDYQIKFSKEVLAAHIQTVNVSISSEEASQDGRTKLLVEYLQQLWRETLPRMTDSLGHGRVAFEKEWDYHANANLHVHGLADLPFKNTELHLEDEGRFGGIKLTVRGEVYHIDAHKSWWLSIDETVLEPHGKSRYLGAPEKEWKKRRDIFELQQKLIKKFVLRGGVAHGPGRKEDDDGNVQNYADDLEGAYQHQQIGGIMYIPDERDADGRWQMEFTETASLMDPSPIDQVLEKSDVRVLRSFGISELSVSQTADIGSFAMAVMHRLVLMSVVQGILRQFVNSFKRYVIDKHVAENFDEAAPKITITFPNLTDLPDSLIVEFVKGVLQSPTLSPLVLSGAIDLRQILESVGVPLADDVDARLKVAFEDAKKAAAAGPPMPGGGGDPFGRAMGSVRAPQPGGGGAQRFMSLANRLGMAASLPSREDLVGEALSELDRLYGRLAQEMSSQREGKRDVGELREIIEQIRDLEADVRTASRILGMVSLWEPAVQDNPAGSGTHQVPATDPAGKFLTIASLAAGSPFDQPGGNRFFRFPWVERAVEFLMSKSAATSDELRQIAREDRSQVFSLPGVNDLSLVDDIKRELAHSAALGESLEQFERRVEDKLHETGLARHQVETAYRTNTHQGYVQGQHQALMKPAVKAQFPYVLFVATADNRVRDNHWDLDGLVAQVGSPLHQLFLKALEDYNCRCTLIPLNEEQALARGINTLENASAECRRYYGMTLAHRGRGVTLGGMRAPKGGAMIAGKKYKGGQFIPGDELEKASKEERAALAKSVKAAKSAESKPASAARYRPDPAAKGKPKPKIPETAEEAVADMIGHNGQNKPLFAVDGVNWVDDLPEGSLGEEYEVIIADVGKLDQAWEQHNSDFRIPPGGGGAEIKGRRERFQEFIESDPERPIEMPRIDLMAPRSEFNDSDDPVFGFGNGRHRFSYMRDNGKTAIPVVVSKTTAQMAKEMFGYSS